MGQYRSKPEFASAREEAKTVKFRQAVIAEFIATFIFLFITIGCVVFTQDGGISTARQMQVSLVFGNAITILIFIFAGVSGANINPAVSWALFVTGKISGVRCFAYSCAQVLGAICGTAFVRIMTPALFDKVDGGANNINKNATAKEALGVEFGCTFLLVLTVMAAVDNVRSKAHAHIPTIAPICIGLAVTGAHFVAIPVDNCSINPARSFGTSAVSGNWNDHAVFWFGPYFGATAAALMWMFLFHTPDHAEANAGTAAAAASLGMAKQDSVQITDSRPLDGGRMSSPAPAAYSGSSASAAAAPSSFNPAYSYGPSVGQQGSAAFTGRSGNAAFGSPEASAVGSYGNQSDGQDWK